MVDPDALNQLFAGAATAGRTERQFVFTYDDYRVTVHGDGQVVVRDPGAENATCPSCNDADGDETSRNRGELDGVIYSFECPACSHEWSVSV